MFNQASTRYLVFLLVIDLLEAGLLVGLKVKERDGEPAMDGNSALTLGISNQRRDDALFLVGVLPDKLAVLPELLGEDHQKLGSER